MRRLARLLVTLLGVTLATHGANAQMTPGGGAPPSAGKDEKEEGPAESAPEDKNENPALQPIPAYPQQKEKSLQFFQLNGYIRFRAYLFNNFNLGLYGQSTGPQNGFPIPFSEYNSSGQGSDPNKSPSSCAGRNNNNCRDNNITSADMRLRLEPTINVTEQVKVKAQIDVFDNLVMGSTPESYFFGGKGTGDVPLVAFSRTQVTPEPGLNSIYSSIRAKRAWAEVGLPFGRLSFGRQPSHWGMGMLVNNGDCLDCDYGNNADRVMFATRAFGHFFAFLWDWVATGPTTQLLDPRAGQGVYYNAEPLDDTSQWILALGKREETPEILKEKLDAGKTVFNYGGYFIYRQQTWADNVPTLQPYGNSPAGLQSTLVKRGAYAFIGDIWLRLDWKKLHLEVEGAVIAGKVDNIQDQFAALNGQHLILSGGFAFKGHYKLLKDALKIYLEVGFASGDDAEDPSGIYNVRLANPVPDNHRIGRFMFDPDYHVDLILFRRVIGTVSNAAYLKPGVSYDIFDSFGARVDIMYAVAHRPVAYPGNSANLGLEIDAALMYKNEEEGFYAGLVYGVLFPFAGLSYPASIYTSQYAKDSEIAQTFQARLYVKF